MLRATLNCVKDIDVDRFFFEFFKRSDDQVKMDFFMSSSVRAFVWDLVVIAVASVVFAIALITFDVFERFFLLTRYLERYELDELVLLAPAMALMLSWFSVRRWLESQKLSVQLRERLDEIHELNQQFNLAARAGTLGVWSCDFEKWTVHWNSIQQEIYQLRPNGLDDAIKNWYQNVDPMDQALIEQLFYENNGSSEPLEYGFRLIGPNGKVRHIRSQVAPQRDETGKLIRLSGIDQDITDYVNMIDQLRLRSAAVEETADGIMITGTADNDYAIEYVNPAFEALTGYKAAEVIGRNPRFLNKEIGRQDQINEIRRAFQTGSNAMVTLKNRKKDGTDIWIELSISPVRDEHNQIKNYVGVQHDVTEREQAQAQLISYGEILRAVSQVLSHYIDGEKGASDIFDLLLAYFLDVTGSSLGFIGTVEHTSAGAPYLNICAVSDASAWEPSWRERALALEEHGLEFHNMDTLFGKVITSRQHVICNEVVDHVPSNKVPEGHPPLERFMGVPLWARGTLVGVVGIANREDEYTPELIRYVEPLSFATSSILLSEREKADHSIAEEKARRSQKMDALGRLTGGLAHEYNNVLGGVRLNLDLALETAQNEKTKELLHRSIDALSRGSGIAQSLLAFSRRRQIDPISLDLNSFIGDLVEMLTMSVGEDINLRTKLHSSWFVRADPSLLQSTILNLVLNARDAIEWRGEIIVRTDNITPQQMRDRYRIFDVETDCVMMTVTDDGIGISDTDVSNVFDPFFTGDSTNTRTGLGLSIIHGFVIQSGGRIWIDSVLGKGTTIRIVFPRTKLPVETLERPQHEAKNKIPAFSVLIVEDREEFGSGLVQLLESQGNTIKYVRNGSEAFRVLDGGDQFDLIIADVMMPGGVSGIDILQRARHMKPPIPTLLISGHDDEKLATHLSEEEISHVLRKPFGKQDLLERLGSVLREFEGGKDGANIGR